MSLDILTDMFKNKLFCRIFNFLFIPGVGLGLLNPFSVVHAESEVLESLAKLLAVAIDVLLFLCLIALDSTGILFGTEVLTSDDFLDEAIRPMWVFVRNLVNLFFVGVIIFIALGNLYSSITGSGSWTIKEKLPRLIAAMVLINFSLLGMVIILDAVYVGTVAMFGISDSALEGKTAQQLLFEENLCSEEIVKRGPFEDTDHCIEILDPQDDHGGSPTFASVVNSMLCDGDSDGNATDCPTAFLTREKLNDVLNDNPTAPGRNVMAAVASQLMHIEVLPLVVGKGDEGIYDIFRLLNSTVFSFVMAIAYMLGFIALFVGMLMRTVYIWIVMIASPLLVADIVLGLGLTGNRKDEIINTIIMPVKAAAAFSVAFVLTANLFTLEIDNLGTFIELGVGTTKFGKVGLDILWLVATVMIFWAAIWAAFEKTIAKGVTDKIKGFGESVGKLALQGVANTPILPTGKKDADGNNINLTPALFMNAKTLVDEQARALKTEGRKNSRLLLGLDESIDKLTQGLNDAFDKSTKKHADAAVDLRTNPVDFDVTDNGDVLKLQEAIKKSGLSNAEDLERRLQVMKDTIGEDDEVRRKQAFIRAFEEHAAANGETEADGRRLAERLLEERPAASTTPTASTSDVLVGSSTIADGGTLKVSNGSVTEDIAIVKYDKDVEIHIGDPSPETLAAVKKELGPILAKSDFTDKDPDNYDVTVDGANIVIKPK